MKLIGVASLVVLGSALALSGCGGDSDSSGSYVTSYKTKIFNGNEYSCPSEAAQKDCKTDTMCKAAKCKLTKEVTKPFDPENTENCKTDGKTVYGQKRNICKVTLSFLNQGKPSEVICADDGKIILAGGLQSKTGSIKVNDYLFTCQ
jgi:hypothetical protein